MIGIRYIPIYMLYKSNLGRICMRSGRTQTGMNFLQPFTWHRMVGTWKCWFWNDMFCLINIRLKSIQAWNFWTWSEICCLLHEKGTNSDRYENFSSRSSNWDEVRPVTCKGIKRNVWRPMRTQAGLTAGLSLSWSHVNTPLTRKCIDRPIHSYTSLFTDILGYTQLYRATQGYTHQTGNCGRLEKQESGTGKLCMATSVLNTLCKYMRLISLVLTFSFP